VEIRRHFDFCNFIILTGDSSMTKLRQSAIAAAVGAALACGMSSAVSAAEWSDTSLSYKYGTKFHEPFNANDIGKNIVGFTHVNGYKYGTNLIAADLLLSDSKDPGSGTTSGAQEVYAVYRNTIDFAKVTGKEYKFGFVKDVGVTLGFDANTKNNGYGSKKRMFVAGPTLMMDVPSMLNITLYEFMESNAPNGYTGRYTYKAHPALEAVWGIPLGASGFSFEGMALFIAAKGKDEFNAQTKAETNIDAKLMYDLSPAVGTSKGTLKVGFEYQWWKNKFGNDSAAAPGPGAFAKTPMLRAEYHF